MSKHIKENMGKTPNYISIENDFKRMLGLVFVLFLPSYSLIKALFPTKELDNIERLALVPITGLLLNYTPWGIRTTPIALSLLALTTTFATAALIREQQAKTQQNT